MKAVAYRKAHAIDAPEALQDIELDAPLATGRDLLVEIRAISVNPVDTKIRANVDAPEGQWKVIGWDAAGIVRGVGPDVTHYKVGDRVSQPNHSSAPWANSS